MPTLIHRIVLAGTESEVPLARRDIVERVRAWGVPLDEETVDAIRLVASELIANAVIHGAGPITVALYHSTGRLVIDVLDGSTAAPRAANGGADAESGRGLSLVGLLALSWAWEPTDRGKRVWAELALPAPLSVARVGVPRDLPTTRAGGRTGAGPEFFTPAAA
ncbi:ATP-binding protein [Streptomyces sp. NPDC046985]|uniref:ATP-binding protein n=1 Tax=Streptomyces sp. NPDC046985 TaxID=3155377 RepID=UPI003402D3F8